MKRLFLASLIVFLFGTIAQAAPQGAPPIVCDSPSGHQAIVDGLDQILSQNGASVYKLAWVNPAAVEPGTPAVRCTVAFEDTNGIGYQGAVIFHYNLVGQLMVLFQDYDSGPMGAP